jgi:hypothetical protein
LLVSGCWLLVAGERAFGQSSQNAVDPTRITKEAVQAILGASLCQSNPAAAYEHLVILGPEPASACSIPLIEAQIPKDVTFTITQVPPASDFRDNMPVAHGLPACPTGR